MNTQKQPDAQALAASYKGIYREMHTLAAAVTGSERAAEETLMHVILTTGKNPGRRRALEKTKLAALDYAHAGDAGMYECFEDDAYLSEEDEEVRRVAFLHGCGLSAGETARALHLKPGRVRMQLKRAFARIKSGDKRRTLAAMAAREMKESAGAPDYDTFTRALENRLALSESEEGGNEAASHAVSGIISIIMLLIIGFLIWVSVILLDYYRQSNAQKQPQAAVTEGLDAGIQGDGN